MSDFPLTLVQHFKTSKNFFCGSSYRQSAGSEVYVIRLSVQRDCWFAGNYDILKMFNYVPPEHRTLKKNSQNRLGFRNLQLLGARWDSNPRHSEPQSDALTN